MLSITPVKAEAPRPKAETGMSEAVWAATVSAIWPVTTELLAKLKLAFRGFRSQPVEGVIALINPILRGWVHYFGHGHASRCFSYVRDWVEKKVRRHLARNSKHHRFGWKRWSKSWIYRTLGLFSACRVNYKPWQLHSGQASSVGSVRVPALTTGREGLAQGLAHPLGSWCPAVRAGHHSRRLDSRRPHRRGFSKGELMTMIRMPEVRPRALALVVAVIGCLALAGGPAIAAFLTDLFPYAVSVHPVYRTIPIISAGDRVPETSDPTKEYQMVGIPDGLGAHRNDDGTVTLYMNHELNQTVQSEPTVGDPLNRGAFVSKWLLSPTGRVISGERAYDRVYQEDTLVGPAAEVGNNTPGFARFCSGSLAGREHGFDRPIYFANEESGGTGTFDGKGGLSVAIFDNEAHGLPCLGRFPWENTLVQPRAARSRFDPRVVIMGMEDGPADQDPTKVNSQLYMYVGFKSSRRRATVLERNGLVGGILYVFKARNPDENSELAFQEGSIVGEWVPIPGARDMTDVQLETASDARNAMVFARPEDGAFNPDNPHEYFFVTTGGAAGANVLGRLYSLKLNAIDPTRPARLSIVYNADTIIADGGTSRSARTTSTPARTS